MNQQSDQRLNTEETIRIREQVIKLKMECRAGGSFVRTVKNQTFKYSTLVFYANLCVYRYNFDCISCESCKSFFRRNAFLVCLQLWSYYSVLVMYLYSTRIGTPTHTSTAERTRSQTVHTYTTSHAHSHIRTVYIWPVLFYEYKYKHIRSTLTQLDDELTSSCTRTYVYDVRKLKWFQ